MPEGRRPSVALSVAFAIALALVGLVETPTVLGNSALDRPRGVPRMVRFCKLAQCEEVAGKEPSSLEGSGDAVVRPATILGKVEVHQPVEHRVAAPDHHLQRPPPGRPAGLTPPRAAALIRDGRVEEGDRRWTPT